MAKDQVASKGRGWGWKPYVFLTLILALVYIPFPSRHPQFDSIGYYMLAKMSNWSILALMPANHVLPAPSFLLISSIRSLLGIKLNLAAFLSLYNSLLMIGAVLLFYGFYKRIIPDKKLSFLCALALGFSFQTIFNATDFDNVALVIFAMGLTFNICWRKTTNNQITSGILSGFIATISVLAIEYLAFLGPIIFIYYLVLGQKKRAITHIVVFFILSSLSFLLIAILFHRVTSFDEFRGYMLGYGGVLGVSGGWVPFSWRTPINAFIGLVRSMLGLHPLMHWQWLEQMARQFLPGVVMANHIATANGIITWLRVPLFLLTSILIITVPFLVWLAWLGQHVRKSLSAETQPQLLALFVVILGLFIIWFLPSAGEYWISDLTVLLPLAFIGLNRFKRIAFPIGLTFSAILLIVNLFGSIMPLADEKNDPVVPFILRMDETRQPCDILLVPPTSGFPQRWLFHWVVATAVPRSPHSHLPIAEHYLAKSCGSMRVYFMQEIFNPQNADDESVYGEIFSLNEDQVSSLKNASDKAYALGQLELYKWEGDL